MIKMSQSAREKLDSYCKIFFCVFVYTEYIYLTSLLNKDLATFSVTHYFRDTVVSLRTVNKITHGCDQLSFC